MITPDIIVLNQAEYDNLIRLLDNPPQLSSRLVNAIKRLDSEGFNFTRKLPMKYKHIRPLLNRKPTNAGITAAFEINGDKVTFGLSVTSPAKTLAKLTVQQVMDKVTKKSNWSEDQLKELSQILLSDKGDSFVKKVGRENAERAFKTHPKTFTLDNVKRDLYTLFHSSSIVCTPNDEKHAFELINNAKTFEELPHNLLNAILYAQFAFYAKLYYPLFRVSKTNGLYVIPAYQLRFPKEEINS